MFKNILVAVLSTSLFSSCGPKSIPVSTVKDVGLVEKTNATVLHYNEEANRYEAWQCAQLKPIRTFSDCLEGGEKRSEYKGEKFFDTLITILKDNQKEIVKDNHRSWVATAADAILKKEMNHIEDEQARYKKEITQIEEFINFYGDELDGEALAEKRKRMLELKAVNDRFAELNLYYKALTRLVADFIVLVQNKETVFYKEVTSEQVYSLLLSKLVSGYVSAEDFEVNFALIPAGTFMRGSPVSERGREINEAQHRVTISKPFEMQVTEVTQAQWFQVMGDNPSGFKEQKYCLGTHRHVDGISLCSTHPVEQVSWYDVQQFIQKLNNQDSSYYYRLPTEAEWEYAARAGTTTPYSVAGLLESFAWYKDNSMGQSHIVGQLKPNDFGLYDMHGNVWEWMSDWYSEIYPNSHVTDPAGPVVGSKRVIRGGSWGNEAHYHRSAYRFGWWLDDRVSKFGFRLVREPK